jgi:imidazolonepropionase-like amidohydrolase
VATSGIDFVKYAGSAHAHGQFLAFSPDAQRAIVAEAHAAGKTAQACTQSPEALKVAIASGVDLLQHGDVTGLRAMPQDTLELICSQQLPCAAFLHTERHLDALRSLDLRWHGTAWVDVMDVKDRNDRRLIDEGAKLLLAHDMGVFGPTAKTSPRMISQQGVLPDAPNHLGRSHVCWLRAAVERGMRPMDALLAATRNIADAYGKSADLGTIEPGKVADLVVLAGDPLSDPSNYERVEQVMKDGEFVDRNALPERPNLSREPW